MLEDIFTDFPRNQQFALTRTREGFRVERPDEAPEGPPASHEV